MQILITGGAGFVGSTVASACEDAGHHPVLIDDLSRGARAFTIGRPFYEGDVADRELLRRVFAEHPGIAASQSTAPDRSSIPESVERPLHYYRNNVVKTVDLVENLHALGCSPVWSSARRRRSTHRARIWSSTRFADLANQSVCPNQGHG